MWVKVYKTISTLRVKVFVIEKALAVEDRRFQGPTISREAPITDRKKKSIRIMLPYSDFWFNIECT